MGAVFLNKYFVGYVGLKIKSRALVKNGLNYYIQLWCYLDIDTIREVGRGGLPHLSLSTFYTNIINCYSKHSQIEPIELEKDNNRQPYWSES